jgi:hypothetical protein
MPDTHLGCATVHQLVTGFLLVNSEVDPVRHVACGIDILLLGVLFVLSTTPLRGGVYGLESWCSKAK